MRKLSRMLQAGLATTVISGCAHIDLGDPDRAISGRPTPPPVVPSHDRSGWGGLAADNLKRLTDYREREGRYYLAPHEEPRRPKACLALSGGGIRSASFSIGVLEGLENKGILERIDIASAVSGGSWALSWFYAQQELALRAHRFAETTDDARRRELLKMARQRLFDTAAAELEEKSHFLSVGEGVAQGVGDILFIPINFVVNGFFDNQFNVSPGRYYYESKLAQTYHSSKDFPTDGRPITLSDLSRLVLANNAEAAKDRSVRRLPAFIFNATAEVDDDVMHHGTRFSNTVYEFTPTWLGNDWFGYLFNDGDNFQRHNISDLARVAAISGAAVDIGGAQNVSPAIRVWWKFLNFGLSENIPNPNPTLGSAHLAHHFVPWPFYLLDYHTANPEGVRIRLGDGGFSENWGVYSLVRRGCEEIYVIDAEHDPAYQFEAYHRLKSGLKSEMDLDVAVADIDNRRPQSSPLTREKAGMFPDQRRPSSAACSATAPAPVMTGEIRYLPFPGSITEGGSKIRLNVIKLSLDRGDGEAGKEGYPLEIGEYVRKSREDCLRRLQDDPTAKAYPFPQYPTSNQDYDPEDVRAFRKLGKWIVENHIK